MLFGMLAFPLRHQRMRHSEGLGMGHRLARLQPRNFHFGYAVAEFDYHSAVFPVRTLMHGKLLRERLRREH
jgi:hypothetical protein